MASNRRGAYALAAVILIGVGLLTRIPLIPWPAGVAKYLGSSLWGAMVLCVIGVSLPRLAVVPLMLLAFAVSAAVEISQLWHPAWLDAFRQTTIGVLLLGRYFSFGDIAAYAAGIGAAGAVTMALAGKRDHA
jgi:Protein of unknown function (DUF2809)